MNDKLNAALNPHGFSIGLTNDKSNAGTWEWYEKSTGEYRTGFTTAEDAYKASAEYAKSEYGIELPALNGDGEFETSLLGPGA